MDVMLIFDVVIAIFGVYMIGAALKMKKTGKISSAVITAEEIARCRKTKEFIAFIYWKDGSVRRIDYRCGCPWNYQ